MVHADRLCLACGQNVDDRAGTRPEITMVTIQNIDSIPAVCFLCGIDTTRMQTLSWSFRARPIGHSMLTAPLLFLFSLLPGSEYRTCQQLCITVCPACTRQARKIKPLSVMIGLECRLEVHRRFREHFEALNGRRLAEWDTGNRLVERPPPSATPGPIIRI